MNNDLMPPRIIESEELLKYHSRVFELHKISQNLKIVIKNTKIHAKFVNCKLRLRGYLLWLKILTDIREYGTNSHLFDSFDRYRKDLAVRLRPRNRKFALKTEKTIDYGYLVNPESLFYQLWNLVVLFMLLYAFIVMPWIMAFEEVVLVNNWFIAETCVDFIFFLDIIVTLNTAYFDLFGRIVANRRKICINYLKGMLILDIISVTPFYLLEQGTIVKSNSLIRIIRITSIARVLRGSKILKLIKYLKHSENIARIIRFIKLYRGIIRLLLLVFCVLIMSHFMACMFYYTSKLDNFSENTWVVRFGYIDLPKEIKYLKSLYFIITILTTVGFGDIYPYTAAEMILCITWMMLGIGFYSTIVSTISSVFSSLDSRRMAISEKISDIDKLGKYYDINSSCIKFVKKKISDHIILNKRLNEYQKDKIVQEMPRKIQINIALNIYNGAASKISIFSNKDVNFLIDILPKLHYTYIKPGMIIFNKNDHADNVYFLINGRVSYVLGNKHFQFKSIVSGSHFGEIEILSNIPRKYTVITEELCEVLIMNENLLDEIIAKYPTVGDEIWQLANRKDKKNLECYKEVVEILDTVEIKKEASLRQLAGKKQKKKQEKKEPTDANLNQTQIEESILNEVTQVAKVISKAKAELKERMSKFR